MIIIVEWLNTNGLKLLVPISANIPIKTIAGIYPKSKPLEFRKFDNQRNMLTEAKIEEQSEIEQHGTENIPRRNNTTIKELWEMKVFIEYHDEAKKRGSEEARGKPVSSWFSIYIWLTSNLDDCIEQNCLKISFGF